MIEADISVIDPRAVGRGVTLVVTVTLERERSDVVSELERAVRESADVMQCHYLTGPADFIMILTAASMETPTPSSSGSSSPTATRAASRPTS